MTLKVAAFFIIGVSLLHFGLRLAGLDGPAPADRQPETIVNDLR